MEKNLGWIKLHRSLKNWRFYNRPKYLAVWLEMLFSASYEKSTIDGVEIGRGEFIFSFRSWASKFKNFNPLITDRNLRTIVKNLEKYDQIKLEIIKKQKISKITIKNYEEYQQKPNERHASNAEKTDTVNDTVTHRKLTQSNQKTDTVNDTVKSQGECVETPCMTNKNQLEMFGAKEKRHSNCMDQSEKRHSNDQKVTQLTTLLKEDKKKKESNNKNITSGVGKVGDNKKSKSKASNDALRIKEICINIITHYNKESGREGKRKYSAKSKNTVKLIKAIISSGYTENDIMNVISFLAKDWKYKRFSGGIEAYRFFVPDTIFKLDKFEKYFRNLPSKSDVRHNSVSYDDLLKQEHLKKEKQDQEKLKENQKQVDEILKEIDNNESNVIGNDKFFPIFPNEEVF